MLMIVVQWCDWNQENVPCSHSTSFGIVLFIDKIYINLAQPRNVLKQLICRSYIGRDRLEIQIRKLNKVSSYHIDHTVSQMQ